ncbi:hypothetical protein [Paludisphaera rhizosphaerae]|uniref:hypothetical protein n=1 Tax=Paludisphaera rhizosphaerae TaxID=2711216 RepID=UPI0013EBB46B|nr:hypothetical protein [Paludisphaera rhizosphaerae]
MSQPSRPRAQSPAQRRNRTIKLEGATPLEARPLMAPVVPVYPLEATFTAATTPTNSFLGTVVVDSNTTATTLSSPAPITSVAELTPLSSFGGDMVKVEAGPGGVFGNGLYAISRGAGGNTNAVNRPGVIYRVDPATGKASVFFDLNTVMNQLDPTNALNRDGSNPAAASLGGATTGGTDTTGYANWYDITFDREGVIDGTPSMLVSVADRNDPAKNAVYRISADGTFLGAYVTLTDGQAATKFNINPTAIVVPSAEMQNTIRGLVAGSGISSTGGTLAALYFNSNEYSSGQVISNASSLPKGVSETGLSAGTIAGITQANIDYFSPLYSIFTDFGTPSGGGIVATPGVSGVQGSNGELLIAGPASYDPTTDTLVPDYTSFLTTPFRRFEDIAFDQYSYFAQAVPLTATAATTGASSTTYTVSGTATYAGNLFVSDLATGLYVTVTSVAEGDIPAGVSVNVPVQGSGVIGIQKADPSQPYNAVTNPLVPIVTNGNTTGGSNIGGRIVRITPDGLMTTFAQGFDTSGAQDYTSFLDSELSITFSADGTVLYASDGDGIWQFKTTSSLAGSTSGTIVGLNDLRTLGVPYDGQGSAVAVIDTGVDSLSSPFRGRVANGTNVYNNGTGTQDLASGPLTTTGNNNNNNGGNTGGNTGTTGGSTNLANTFDGHGTPVAGVVAQFVPQSTIDPVSIFSPWFGSVSFTQTGSTNNGGNNNGGGNNNNNNNTTLSATANALTSTNAVYQGLAYVASHPYVNDPVRSGQVSRVIASTLAFGTTQTWTSEAQAYRNYPQIVIALKLQLKKFRSLGIAPIAAAGQFGSPLGLTSGGTTGNTGGGNTGGTTTSNGTGLFRSNADSADIGDNNGMSMPAILNETLSVTGTYPFPYTTDATTTPLNTPTGVIPYNQGPVLVFQNSLTIGGGSTDSNVTSGISAGTNNTNVAANVTAFANSDFNIWADRIPGSVNRGITTDFAAPSIDVPTFRRRLDTTTISGTTTTTNDDANRLTFTQVGTSMSTGILTGAYSMVSSALNYWTNLNKAQGLTADAYLTTPVGVNSLNFGAHGIGDLSAYNNPDGINGILAWTAVPVYDVNDGSSVATPALLSTTDKQNKFEGANVAPAYARVSISNAIAAIEGTEALNYLISNNYLTLIDANNDGLITAQEVQSFTDTAATKGLAEAGAMARLLGGTASYAQPDVGINNTAFNENPDQAGALQRRFNFFDYVANGKLNGAVSIDSLKMLAGTLLPSADAYVIVDRQRASANGFLVDPQAQRNTTALQHKLPQFMWVSKAQVAKFRGMNPNRFKINRNEAPGTYLPYYTLFDSGGTTSNRVSTPVVTTKTVNGETIRVLSYKQGAVISNNTSSNSGTTTSSTDTSTSTSTTTTNTPTTGTTTTSTTPATSTSTDSTTPTTTTTSSDTSTSSSSSTTDQSNQVVAALLDLASKNSSTATSTTLGTATPMAAVQSDSPATTGVAASTTTAAATSTAAVSTEAPTTPTVTTTPAAATTSADLTTQQQAAAQAAAAKALAYKKAKAAQNSKSTLSKLWDDIKSPFS